MAKLGRASHVGHALGIKVKIDRQSKTEQKTLLLMSTTSHAIYICKHPPTIVNILWRKHWSWRCSHNNHHSIYTVPSFLVFICANSPKSPPPLRHSQVPTFFSIHLLCVSASKFPSLPNPICSFFFLNFCSLLGAFLENSPTKWYQQSMDTDSSSSVLSW